MTELLTPEAILFLDFDGTISRRDAVDAILETYAEPKWLAYEEEWRAGRMGSRDCLYAQMALVRATKEQLDALLDEIELDEDFGSLLEMCSRHSVPVHIISDGFDYCIHRILSRAGNGLSSLMHSIRVCASRLVPERHYWRTEFPYFYQACAHGCATCKPAVMRLLNRTNAPAIFVGDGLSDRYAVESADIVFAKAGLAEYCLARSIEHVTYKNLGDVAAHVESLLASSTSLRGESESRASA
ncbi:MAG TPA: HAD-IB family phosphatase [Pyrinomonadaceae bacterium]|nr:HAD-IB family phosphatase [Pyrinomonadaceae bacterium]